MKWILSLLKLDRQHHCPLWFLISTTGLSLWVWCLGRAYPFFHQVARIFFFKEIVWTWGGGKERKGTPFLSAIKDKTLDLGFGLCVCTTSKGAEKCRQLGAKPPLVKSCWVAAPRTMRNSTLYSWWAASCHIFHLDAQKCKYEVLKQYFASTALFCVELF